MIKQKIEVYHNNIMSNWQISSCQALRGIISNTLQKYYKYIKFLKYICNKYKIAFYGIIKLSYDNFSNL